MSSTNLVVAIYPYARLSPQSKGFSYRRRFLQFLDCVFGLFVGVAGFIGCHARTYGGCSFRRPCSIPGGLVSPFLMTDKKHLGNPKLKLCYKYH
jgi:hypothetical protein